MKLKRFSIALLLLASCSVQRTQNGANPFHMNDALNGIPLGNSVHLGSHSHYDNLVQSYLQAIPTNATPDQAYDAIVVLVGKIRTAINDNPGVHVNDLIF